MSLIGTTATYGLRYPEATDRPTGDEQLGALAEDVETAAKVLNPDTGSQQNAPVLAADGWELLINDYRQIGKIVALRVWAKRTGAPLTASSAGNIAGVQIVATVTDPALRPAMVMTSYFRASFTSGGGWIQPNGEMEIFDAHSNSTIETYTDEQSSTVQLYFVYPIA